MSATPSNTPCQLQLSPPIGIPIANTTVSDGTPRRGVILSVGTPKQDLVFVVSG